MTISQIARDMRPSDWIGIAVTVVGLAASYGATRNELAHTREEIAQLRGDFRTFDDRLWQLKGARPASATAVSCPADATRVSLYYRLKL